MVLSVSRRTDIPAYYGEWFIRRIRAGFCEVTNPFNPAQRRRVDLRPDVVECIVFWTRHPKTLFPRLHELECRGYLSYFTYTVLDYPRFFEPQLPALSSRITMFKRVSDLLGPHRVVWRYDPILFTTATGPDFHRNRFEALCRELSGYTDTVVVSIYDHYRKLDSRMRSLAEQGSPRTFFEADVDALRDFMYELRGIAAGFGLRMQSCAEDCDLSGTGIEEGACIDPGRIAEITGKTINLKKDSGQRRLCNCVASTDIGAYDTCPAGCVYCYATGRQERVHARMRAHDPDAPGLSQ